MSMSTSYSAARRTSRCREVGVRGNERTRPRRWSAPSDARNYLDESARVHGSEASSPTGPGRAIMTRNISLIILLAGSIGVASAQSAGAVCGDGTPDPGEQCDLGAGNGTPGSCCTSLCEFRAVGLVCRAAAGPCDVAETCTGADGNCPAD
ncbi:MAG: hypothetical protein E6J70_16060, partial [Deltaproteobacteria bacterium]